MNEIKEITSAEARDIFDTREPRGGFIVRETNGAFTAIDNMDDCAFCEEFDTLRKAEYWLQSGGGCDEAEDIRNGETVPIFLEYGRLRAAITHDEFGALYNFISKTAQSIEDYSEIPLGCHPLWTVTRTLGKLYFSEQGEDDDAQSESRTSDFQPCGQAPAPQVQTLLPLRKAPQARP